MENLSTNQKRERQSFGSISDVIHRFANLDERKFEAQGRAGNVYFEYGVLYSYGRHFAIAKYIEQKDKLYVLFSTDSYSISTSSHQNQAKSALNHYTLVFVPSASNTPRENFDAWKYQAKEILSKLAKAKKPMIYLDQLEMLAAEVKTYTEIFKQKTPKELKRLLEVKDTDEYKEIAAKQQKAHDASVKRAEAKLKAEHLENLEKWRKGEGRYLARHGNFDYLRFNAKENRIETSQAVQIPYTAAKRFFETLQTCRKNQDFQPCIGAEIIGFELKEMTAEFIRVGCHRIGFDEIDVIARQLNWTN